MNENLPKAVPLVEQLRSIPSDAVLRIDTPNALGCMDTRNIPVGRLCHEAAASLHVQEHAQEGEPADETLTLANPSEKHFRERIATYADKHPTLLVRQLATLLRDAWRTAGVALPDGAKNGDA